MSTHSWFISECFNFTICVAILWKLFLYFFEDIKYTYFKVIFDIPKIEFSSLSSVIYHILEILVCNSTLSDSTFPCSLGSFFPVCGFVDRLNKYCGFSLSKARFHTDASVLLSHNNIGETSVWLSCDLLGTLAGILPTWMFLLLRRTPPSPHLSMSLHINHCPGNLYSFFSF